MPQHKWGPSTLGHGEQQCAWCKCTNREAAALGIMDECDKAPPNMTADEAGAASAAKMRELAAKQDDPGAKAYYLLQAELMPAYVRWITSIGIHLSPQAICQVVGSAAISLCLDGFANAAQGQAEMSVESVMEFLKPIIEFQMTPEAHLGIGSVAVKP